MRRELPSVAGREPKLAGVNALRLMLVFAPMRTGPKSERPAPPTVIGNNPKLS